MQLTLADVISLATRFAGRSDFSVSEVSQLANLALAEIVTRTYHKPNEVVATSNLTGGGNERRVQLPTDFDYPLAIKHYSTSTDSAGVNVLGAETDLDVVSTTLLDSFSSASGAPVRCTVYGGFLELDPIPDSRASLVLRYIAKQPVLVTSTSTPYLDERWHPAWVDKTEELVHRARGNALGAQEAERRYVNYMVSTPNDRQQDQMSKKGLGLWVRRS
jgi:hypothetical protein